MNQNKVKLLKCFKEYFRMDDDPWGHTMEWFFTIAELLYFTHGKNSVPENWKFTPGAYTTKLNEEDFPLIYDYDLKYYPMEDLIFFGNFLNRMSMILTQKGHSY